MRPNLAATARGRHAPTTITQAIDWRELAECRPGNGVSDDEIWYPNSGSHDPDPINATQARGICAGCPVKAACLDDAMTREGGSHRSNRHGIRGGLTGKERHDLYRARKGTP